jgi:hypothetical protein
VALVRASVNLELEFDNEDQEIGAKIVCEAVKSPIKQMAQNAGESADLILYEVLSLHGNDGRDFTTGKLVDMFEEGIIDPAKVTKSRFAKCCLCCLYTNHNKLCNYSERLAWQVNYLIPRRKMHRWTLKLKQPSSN